MAKSAQNPKFSATEQRLVDEANAKAQAKDPKGFAATQAAIAKGRQVPDAAAKVAAAPAIKAAAKAKAEAHIAANAKPVTKVPTHAADGATEKAPHTKRAVQQNAEAAKLEKAKVAFEEARAEFARLEKIANATDVKAHRAGKSTPARLAAFTAKAVAGEAMLKAQKALGKLKRELETPEQRAEREAAKPAKAAKTEAKAPRAPRAATNRTIAKGANVYANPKGGWTLYMVTLTLKHKDTDSATAAHKAGAAKAGQPADKPLDFKWMDAKGYIKLG